MRKQYLVWIDILGFNKLAKMIAEDSGVEVRKVRHDFVDVIEQRVTSESVRTRTVGMNFGQRDDWILVADSLDSVFEIVCRVLDHNTGYKNYEKIPLEIAIGTGEYDRWAEFSGTRLIVEESTVEFLKSNIIKSYHEWHRQNHDNQSPESTFVILTKSVYDLLEPLDKKMCRQVVRGSGLNGISTNVFFVADVDKFKERGRVFEFLEKVNHPKSRLYHRIESVFVEPDNHREIQRTLELDKVVFITGTAEYGKTYTAVRLLWECYLQGYQPTWVEGEEESERREVRKIMQDIGNVLTPGSAIYLEDPFGKVKYERRERLERDIATIVTQIQAKDDVRVIVTSREEVFKQFEEGNLSSLELKKLQRKLNIKKPSYNREKRIEMLLKWAESRDCKWYEQENLKEKIVVCMADETILPTPLSIRDFVFSTIDIEVPSKLIEKMEEKSEETARSFAREIREMTDDRILVLAFPFISDFSIAFVREEYKRLVIDLGIANPRRFGEIIDWFKDDKISIHRSRLAFSHPSYGEALKYLLEDRGQPTRINTQIFCKVLHNVSKKDVRIRAIARFVYENLKKFPPEASNELLLNLSGNDRAVVYVVRSISEEFEGLPQGVKNKLLLNLSRRNAAVAAQFVAEALSKNLDELPEDLWIKLLRNLKQKGLANWMMSRFVMENLDKLPEEMKDLPYTLSERDDTAWVIARSLVSGFDRYPVRMRRLLPKLAVTDETAEDVLSAVLDNLDALPQRIRERLLLLLTKRSDVACFVVWGVAENFDVFPDFAAKMLNRLARRDGVSWAVARVLVDMFHKLPEDVTLKLLPKLAQKSESAWAVAKTLIDNSDNIPEEIIQSVIDRLGDKLPRIITELSESDKHRKIDALEIISLTRSELDESLVRRTLKKLLHDEDEEVRARAQALDR